MANLSNINNKFLVTTGGDVGIGTTSPGKHLEIAGTGSQAIKINSTNTGQAELWFASGVVSPSIIYNPSNDASLRIYTNGADRVTVNNLGNVGIGTTSPSEKLEVTGSTLIGGNLTSANLYIQANNTAGSSSMTTSIQMAGYGGRGIGTFFTDSTYSGKEWYVGLPYSGGFANYQIGYDASGSQGEYIANSLFSIYKTGQLTFNSYGINSHTGTTAYALGVTSAGTVIELEGGDLPGGPYLPLSAGSSYPLTGDLIANTQVFAKGGANIPTSGGGTINAYSRTVSTNLFSALRVWENTSASNYWDIGTTGAASTLLNFYHNAGTTPKISFTHTGNIQLVGGKVQLQSQPTTQLEMVTNQLTLYAGGLQVFTGYNALNDGVEIGNTTGDMNITLAGGANQRILYLEGSSGNVGIGTTTLNRSGLGIDHTVVTIGTDAGMGMLELQGTRTSDADLGRIAWLNAGTRRSEIVVSRIDENTSTKMSFRTSNAGSLSTKMTIAKNGNVGIGTDEPRDKLTVKTPGSASVETGLRLVNPFGFGSALAGARIIFAQDRSDSENFEMAAIQSTQSYSGSSGGGGLAFYTRNTTLQKAMHIKNTGAVEIPLSTTGSGVTIGTTNNAAKLNVGGPILAATNDTTSGTYVTRNLLISHPAASTFTVTFNPVNQFGFQSQGGVVSIEASGWQSRLDAGKIVWNNAGGGGVITAVYYVQESYWPAGYTHSITVGVNSANNNTIDVTFTNWHHNSHGWYTRISATQ